MDTIKQIVLQEDIERRYNRKHIDGYIREAILSNPDMVQKIAQGVALVESYMYGHYYESKTTRIKQLHNLDIEALVLDVFTGVAYCLKPELFTSVTAQLASRLKFSDKTEAITTVAEIMAVLCITDAFDITKADRMASLMVVSRIQMDQQLVDFIENSQYLPPMVCEPLELTNNFSSGYLTHNDSLILGKGNQHDGDICLDVLNTMNKVALRLDTEFLSKVEEEPSTEFTLDWAHAKALEKGQAITDAQAKERVNDAVNHWQLFKEQGYEFYKLMVRCGNEFYLTTKVDKRGRIYCSGYHISYQGTPFKKASIELSKQELVTGVP